MTPPRLILASTSRYRAELLARLGVPFESRAPDYDEGVDAPLFDTLAPEAFARHLARQKAASLSSSCPESWILAADQIGVLESEGARRLLKKPGTEEAAVDQLMAMAGRTHSLITAVVLAPPDEGKLLETVDQQRLTMRAFDRAEARAYVSRCRPLDCAGSYRIEDAGIALFERIEGQDYTGIIGLPLLRVAGLLREAQLL